MTPEQVVEALIQYAGDIYDEADIRGWLLESPGYSIDSLPSDFRSCVWSLELKRTVREVMLSFPDWINVPHFLDYWNELSIAERLAYMASEADDTASCGCGCGE